MDQISDKNFTQFVNFNNTDRAFPDDVTIHQLFEKYASLHPDDTAVICDNDLKFTDRGYLTYGELNTLANQLARCLRDNGMKPDMVAGICTERSFAMIIGILAILKSGGAYLPLSPDYPQERISYMLSDSSAEILLVQDNTRNKFHFDGMTLNIEDQDIYTGSEENLPAINDPKDLAYVIYTSGSTGRPKGVMIEHRSVVNRLSWMQNAFPLYKNDVILQKTPFFFDVSVWELFWWMIAGAKMCFLMPGGEKIPLAITSAITKHSVTTLHFVPSMLNVFLEYLEGKDEFQLNKLNSINKIFSSGETLAPSYVKKFNNIFKKNEIKLINLYGPTEAAVDVSYYECPRNNYFDKIPIGKPIDNTRFYIINAGELQGIGQTGELCISGICLARGYINNQELTESRFVDNPFLPGRKMYKTGDLARWLEDGNVEYLGREDHQVKIRGLRIELGEIESVIREYEDVKDCLVSVNRYSENITLIIAYVVCRPGLDLAKLKAYAGRYLPDYMMPSHFIEIEGIPLLSNGKADRKSLPEPVLSAAK